jgi:hypothetical protein
MTRHFTASIALGFCVSFLLPAVSMASAIFTNFGSGQSYNISAGNAVGNGFTFDGSVFAEGSTFTPAANAKFGSLDIALSCAFSCPDPFTVALSRDGGDQPGTVIESFAVAGASLGALGVNNPPLVLNSALLPTLTAGTQYWVTVSADLNNAIAWNLNSTSDISNQAISVDGGASWFSPSGLTPGAYEVDSQSTAGVPEPGSFVLLATALSFCLMRRFASRRA